MADQTGGADGYRGTTGSYAVIRYPAGHPDDGGPEWDAWHRDVDDAIARGYPLFAAEQHAEVKRDERKEVGYDQAQREAERNAPLQPERIPLGDGTFYLAEEHVIGDVATDHAPIEQGSRPHADRSPDMDRPELRFDPFTETLEQWRGRLNAAGVPQPRSPLSDPARPGYWEANLVGTDVHDPDWHDIQDKIREPSADIGADPNPSRLERDVAFDAVDDVYTRARGAYEQAWDEAAATYGATEKHVAEVANAAHAAYLAEHPTPAAAREAVDKLRDRLDRERQIADMNRLERLASIEPEGTRRARPARAASEAAGIARLVAAARRAARRVGRSWRHRTR